MGDASVNNSVCFDFDSKYAITVSLVKADLMLLNKFCSLVVQRKLLFFFVNYRKGSLRSLNCGINFAQYVAIPKLPVRSGAETANFFY